MTSLSFQRSVASLMLPRRLLRDLSIVSELRTFVIITIGDINQSSPERETLHEQFEARFEGYIHELSSPDTPAGSWNVIGMAVAWACDGLYKKTTYATYKAVVQFVVLAALKLGVHRARQFAAGLELGDNAKSRNYLQQLTPWLAEHIPKDDDNMDDDA